MTAVANNPGLWSIASLSDHTGWFPLDNLVDDIGFNITGTWVGTIALQVSNQADYTKTLYSTVVSYSSNQPPLCIPREAGRFFRFIFTAYTSGTAYIGLSKGRDTGGSIIDVPPQGQRTGGSS